MGNSQSEGGSLSGLYKAYDNTIAPQLKNAKLSAADVDELRAVIGAGEFLGGAEGSCLGGYDALQDYGNSLFSRAKEKLIREIAEEVFSALKISGAKNAKTAPISDVVAHLKKLSPNPAKGKRFNESFNSSAGKQKAVCHALANAINSNYGGRIINMDAGDSEMCNQVAEVMHSLLTGLHTEFLNVAGDVTRIMKNMQTVENALEAAYKKQVELVNASGDARLKEQSNNSAKLYQEIKAEYDRQAAVLANLMNVSISPAGKSIISSLEDNRDFAGLVRDLKAETGTTAFGDKLAHLLSGISTVAHSAELIDKALRKIGMSVNEFKSAKNAGDLRVKVLNTIMKDSPNSKALDEMMAAAQIIFNNNYDHDAISKLLNGSSAKKGRGESYGGVDSDSDKSDTESDKSELEVAGGEDVMATYWQKKSLSKKIENKTKYRNLVLSDFRKLLKVHCQKIVEAANQLSGKVGRSIPVSDNLDYFIRAFSTMPNLDKENMHIALSGYPKDSVSREKRENFINAYLLLDQAIEPLVKGPEGHLFKNLQSVIRALVKSIDDFTEKIVKALTEIHVDRPDEIQSALKKSANLFYGSGDSGDDMFGSGNWVAVDKVKNEMKYFYSIANIKTNMSRFADDVKSYADDYEQLLGEEAGWLINSIRKEFTDMIDNTDPTKAAFPGPVANTRANKIYDALRAYHNVAGNADRAKLVHKNLVKLWTMQLNAKETMVKVAQAVDLYLKSFTDGIARHPDAISSVVKMLDQVDIVARWFTDKSGDNLSYLFEMFPETVEISGGQNTATYSYGGANNAPVKDDGSINLPNKQHYYEYVEEQAAAGHLPGNPFMGRPLASTQEKQLDGIIGLAEKSVKGMRALENILSAFASVGSKFGDLDPQARTFMNPGQMFNGLVEYIKASAFSTQFAPDAKADIGVGGGIGGGEPLTAAIYRSKTEAEELVTPNGKQKIPAVAQASHRPAGGNADAGLHWSSNIGMNKARNLHGIPPIRALDDTNKHGIITGVHNVREYATPAESDRYKVQAIALSAIPCDSSSSATDANFWQYHDFGKEGTRIDMAGWADNFHDTDLLFQLSIKSIVAKIFTVVDAYRLFNRPTVNRELSYSLNPLRTILGGSVSTVKVIPEAAELYLRLPLLAEWYRDTYGFKNDTNAVNDEKWILSIVPSIDGTWSEFVGIIFDKARDVEEGNYTESQAQGLINSMNGIYKAYKSRYPTATIRNIINSFVLEMNRIFGFMKQKEINAYMNQRRDFLTKGSTDGNDENFLDYDILNANDQFGSRPAPSDKFINVGLRPNTNNLIPMQKLQAEIVRLRTKMDADFNKALSENSGNNDTLSISFGETLKNYKKELAAAKSDADQYQIVLQLIQGANKSVNLSADKLIMVHETVATPLALLYGVYKVLAKYNYLVHGASVPNLIEWNKRRLVGPNQLADAAIQLNSADTVRSAYKVYLTHKYDKLLSSNKDATLNGMVSGLAGVGATPAAVCGYFMHGAGAGVATANEFKDDNVDTPHLLQDLLNALTDLSVNSSKLVTCNVGTGGNINVDFSPLQDLCASLLSQVKSNIQKLRTSFPPASGIVTRYEDNANVGSVRWLEENMMEVLFNDRDQCGLNTGYSNHLLNTIKYLTRPRLGGVAAELRENSTFGTVDNAIRGLVYYEHKQGDDSMPTDHAFCNPTRFPWNVIPLKKTADSVNEKAVMLNCSSDAVVAGAEAPAVNGLFPAPVVYFENKNTINNFNIANMNLVNAGAGAGVENLSFNSLLVRFNKLVHMYLFTNLEDGALKIYTPLFESFMNGAASREVLQGQSFPNVGIMDNAQDSENVVQRGVAHGSALKAPADGVVLYTSTALAMRGLATSVAILGTVQKKKHAYDNIAEIPEFMKDRMRANLPYFSKLFQEVYDRADFLKRVLTYTSIKDNIASCVVNNADEVIIRVTSVGVPLKAMHTVNTADNTNYISGLLTRLVDLSASIKKCCDSVYKELNDKTLPFFEPSKDFIAEYKRKNGSLPLMPVSSLLTPLIVLNHGPSLNDPSEHAHLMLPVITNGSNVYKFNNAAKTLLSDLNVDPTIDHFPGAKEIYNMYMESTDGNSISTSEYANTVKLTAKLAKFLNTGVVQARMFGRPIRGLDRVAGAHNCNSVFGFKWENTHTVDVIANPPAAAVINANYAILPLVAPTLGAIVELTENTNSKYSKERLAQIVGSKIGELRNNPRKTLRTVNILDMNIVPINVHAFMREVPFVNILNYAYTFDRMVHDFVLPSYVKDLKNNVTEDNIMIKADSDVTNPRELMVKLLAHPYADLGSNSSQYFGVLASLFNGNDDMKIGRPRYLSNQLWHKALLTSSIQIGYGNIIENMDSPLIGNTNAPLGPAGYEQQRAVMNVSDRTTSVNGDILRRVGEYMANLIGQNNFEKKALVDLGKSMVVGTTKPVEQDIVALSAAAYGVRVDGAVTDIQTHANAPPADAGRIALAAALGIQDVTNDVKSLINKMRNKYIQSDKSTQIANLINVLFVKMCNGGAAANENVARGKLLAGGGVANGVAAIGSIAELVAYLNARLQNVGAAAAAPAYPATGFDANWNEVAAGVAGNVADIGANNQTLAWIMTVNDIYNFTNSNPAYPKLPLIFKKLLIAAYITRFDLGAAPWNAAACRVAIVTLLNSDDPTTASPDRHYARSLFDTRRLGYNLRAGGNVAAIAADKDNDTDFVADELVKSWGTNAMYAIHRLPLIAAASLDSLESKKLVERASLQMIGDPVAAAGLKYRKDNRWSVVNPGGKNMDVGNVVYCAELGRLRFDTKLVRNLTWLVQLQRIMRVVLINHLSWINTPVVRGLKIADPKITEFESNEDFDEKDFDGRNYSVL